MCLLDIPLQIITYMLKTIYSELDDDILELDEILSIDAKIQNQHVYNKLIQC